MRPILPVLRLILLFLLVAMNAGCVDSGEHGILIGKFADQPVRFLKRLDLSIMQGQSWDIPLRSGSTVCHLSGSVPDELNPTLDGCKNMSGLAVLACSSLPEVNVRWNLSSCRSGYGHSLPGQKPEFIFGMGANEDSALDQLDMAEDTTISMPY